MAQLSVEKGSNTAANDAPHETVSIDLLNGDEFLSYSISVDWLARTEFRQLSKKPELEPAGAYAGLPRWWSIILTSPYRLNLHVLF